MVDRLNKRIHRVDDYWVFSYKGILITSLPKPLPPPFSPQNDHNGHNALTICHSGNGSECCHGSYWAAESAPNARKRATNIVRSK